MTTAAPPRAHLTTIYFALGKPSRLPLEAFAGKAVLESFAFVAQTIDRYRPTWTDGALDSGAFSEMNSGIKIDLDAYIAFCLQHGEFYRFIANLDDIRGNVARSQRNHQLMLDAGVRAIPVFHQGEAWSVLDETIAAAPDRYIGIGFQRPIREAERWLDDVFSRVPPDVRVHGFAMVNYLQYPFASVDATTWMHELRALMGSQGQAAEALRYLTQAELLDIVVKKYQRVTARRRWDGKRQGDLFDSMKEPK